MLMQELLSNWQDGRIKLYLMHKLLNFRRAHQELFVAGDYIPLDSYRRIERRALCAFARRRDQAWVVAVVPRLVGEDGLSRQRCRWAPRSGAKPCCICPPTRRAGGSISSAANEVEASRAAPENALALSDVLKNFPVALLYHEEAVPDITDY